MPRGKLLTLRTGADNREVTIYVKGFLGRGEKPDHFDRWLACHDTLVESHGWGATALGYHWQSGRLLPGPVAAMGSVKLAWDGVRIVRNLRRATRLGFLGMLVSEELALMGAHFVHQYVIASRSAREQAGDQAAHLHKLAAEERRVRVVAHSLGCRHVIEAVSQLEPARRPHEIHLCAPACKEDHVLEKLSALAQERTVFTPLARGRALGFTGPHRDYDRLVAIDVGEHFDFRVHGEYKNRFAMLVPRSATPVGSAGKGQEGKSVPGRGL
jgi:hypothetical protein